MFNVDETIFTRRSLYTSIVSVIETFQSTRAITLTCNVWDTGLCSRIRIFQYHMDEENRRRKRLIVQVARRTRYHFKNVLNISSIKAEASGRGDKSKCEIGMPTGIRTNESLEGSLSLSEGTIHHLLLGRQDVDSSSAYHALPY